MVDITLAHLSICQSFPASLQLNAPWTLWSMSLHSCRCEKLPYQSTSVREAEPSQCRGAGICDRNKALPKMVPEAGPQRHLPALQMHQTR